MSKYRNRILVGFGIAFVIYLGLLLFTNTETLIATLATYPWMLLVPVMLLKFISWVFRWGEWHYYLGVIGARGKISLFDSWLIYLAGFTMAVSPGKIAEILKSVVLKVKTGIPIAVSAPVVIAERVVDGFAVLFVVALAYLFGRDVIDAGPYGGVLLLALALLVGGMIAVQIRPLAYFFLDLIKMLPLVRRAHSPLVDFYESSREIFRLKHVIPTTGMGIVAYTVDALGFMIVLSGFGLEMSWTLFLQAAFISGFSAAIGALSGVPNGAGVTEISVTGMILFIIAPANPHITESTALAMAIIDGFYHKWFRVLVGLVVSVIFRKRLFSADVVAAIDEMEAERSAAPTPAT